MKFVVNRFTLLFAAFIFSGSAFAGGFNYSYLSAGYVSFSEDISGISSDLKGDGFGVTGSFAVSENVALQASYSTGTGKVTAGGNKYSADTDSTSFGVLFHSPLSSTVDVLISIGFISASADLEINGSEAGSDSVDGTLLTAGVRSMLSENIEGNASIYQSDIDGESDSGLELGGAFYLPNQVSIDIGYSFNSDGDAFAIGATKYF